MKNPPSCDGGFFDVGVGDAVQRDSFLLKP
jgi:hypothetical protein